MKLTVALMLFCTFQVNANGYSQNVTLVKRNIRLAEAFKTIEKQTGFLFFYDKDVIRKTTPFDIYLKDAKIDAALAACLRNEWLTYTIVANTIIIRPKTSGAYGGFSSDIPDLSPPIEVRGKVVDKEGNPLEGVSVLIKGARKGTVSNRVGEFRIDVPSAGTTLQFSFVGMKTVEMKVGAQTFLNIVIEPDLEESGEAVVITALGIKRKEKSLGYAVQSVGGEQFEKASDVNLMNSLAGKVAGLKVNTASEMFNSSRLSLRGEEPILIVDGVSTKVSYWDLNFNDIESMNVLKGPTAAALYGAEGRNGAIIITTKRGGKSKTTVEVNSTMTSQPGLLTYPKTLTLFGTGNNGVYEYVNGSGAGIEGGGFNWGPKLDGRLIKQWNSPIDPVTGERIPIPWEDKSGGKGNLVKFLESGYTFANNVNVETASDRGSFRMSFSHSYQKGIIPNTKLNISGLSLSGTYDIAKWYNINTSLNYSKQYSPNYRIPGYGPHDYLYSLMFWLGTDIDLDDAKNYWEPGLENIQQRYQQLGFYNNPYLISYENLHSWNKNTIYGQITNNFKILPQSLNLMLRTGINHNAVQQTERVPKSMIYYGQKSLGDFYFNTSQYFRLNADLILTYEKRVSEFLNVNVLLGYSKIYERDSRLNIKTNGLSIPGLFTLKNSINPTVNNNILEEQQIDGLYANLDLNFWKPFYLTATIRNDRVSTLPVSNNSFVYPSAAFSYVISDMFSMPSWLNYLKARGSWTQVNSGWTGSVYGHIPIYSVGSYYNISTLSLGNGLLPGSLQPSGSKTWEWGANAVALNNRISLDFAMYRKTEYDNIINQDVSIASGFTSIKANGREYLRRGTEIMLTGKPVVSKNFSWNTSINWGKTYRLLTELEDEKDRDGYIKLNSRVDQYYFIGWLKAPDNKVIYDANTGLPIRDVYRRFVGYADPDFTFGFQNTFTYKNFSLFISLDGQKGGRYESRLPRMGRAGTAAFLDPQYVEDAANGLKNYVADGVVVTGGMVEYDFEGNITKDTREFAPNTKAVSYQDWAKSYYNLSLTNTESFLDASYIKVRDIRIGYTLPESLIKKTFFKSAAVSLIGNNLMIFTKKESKGDDPSWREPELKTPTPINIGINIDLKF